MRWRRPNMRWRRRSRRWSRTRAQRQPWTSAWPGWNGKSPSCARGWGWRRARDPPRARGAGCGRILVPSLLFIASFSAIFILLGLSATVIGSSLNRHKHTLELIGGAAIVAMGVIFCAAPFVGALAREWHPRRLLALVGRGGPLIAGAAFAIAWTPCTSITLGAILTQAAISSSAAHGALLLAFYSAGLAIPFLLIAVAFERTAGALAIVKRHFGVVIAVGGV